MGDSVKEPYVKFIQLAEGQQVPFLEDSSGAVPWWDSLAPLCHVLLKVIISNQIKYTYTLELGAGLGVAGLFLKSVYQKTMKNPKEMNLILTDSELPTLDLLRGNVRMNSLHDPKFPDLKVSVEKLDIMER